jgi:hypothetical protein
LGENYYNVKSLSIPVSASKPEGISAGSIAGVFTLMEGSAQDA